MKLRFTLTALFITFFVLLVGPEAPVVQAVIKETITLLGTVLRRQNDAVRALPVSAMFLFIVNPEWAAELSFQLSFLATLGLIVVFPLLDRLVSGKGMFLREDLLTTLAA